MKDKDCKYCNYCKHFINQTTDSYTCGICFGICFRHPRITRTGSFSAKPPWCSPFYARACSSFYYSPIKNAWAIPSPSYIDEWKEAYTIRDKLHRDITFGNLVYPEELINPILNNS